MPMTSRHKSEPSLNARVAVVHTAAQHSWAFYLGSYLGDQEIHCIWNQSEDLSLRCFKSVNEMIVTLTHLQTTSKHIVYYTCHRMRTIIDELQHNIESLKNPVTEEDIAFMASRRDITRLKTKATAKA